jgi:hypothetical protein
MTLAEKMILKENEGIGRALAYYVSMVYNDVETCLGDTYFYDMILECVKEEAELRVIINTLGLDLDREQMAREFAQAFFSQLSYRLDKMAGE